MSAYSRLLLAIVLLGSATFRAGPASAQTTDRQPSISVTGEAEVHVEPDIATVTVGMTNVASSADDAMAAVSEGLTAIIAGARALGVASQDIQTTGLSLQPNYRQRSQNDDTPPQIQSYRASNNVSIVVRDLTKASTVLDSAITNGANSIGGISFGLSDTESVKRQALSAATTNAETKAQAIATAAGVTLGAVISISEDSTSVPTPRAMSFALAAAPAAAPAPPVESGDLVVRATVRAVYAI